ncbi:hypothetical protein [Bacillus sp. es.036]|uniref:hypothetical protein n=1 Tax=Bacillus sp. es.036 TaxID=1761764 RepID=UPI000BF9A71B|nr:hypothetical protein [Bacillus sp. es.036]PFG03028.1 hypothetical protein ATG70_4257 [Bacillus sp. es.036]
MTINFGKMKRGRSTNKSGMYFLNNNYEVLYIDCMGECKQRKEVGEYFVNSGTKRIKLESIGEVGNVIHVPKYRTKCKVCEGSYFSNWQRKSTKRAEYQKNWNDDNADHLIAVRHNARAKKLDLLATLTADIVKEIREEQQGRCILSGLEEELEFEHAVPVANGGGSTFENCYFINPYLNATKGNKNIFEWAKEQYNFIQRRFYNILVPMMAERNGMTPKEYEAFVYNQYNKDEKGIS